jgi:FAD/FMN-containing dehydrogenase
MGGISGMAYNIGTQVQHVLELTVVTGKGKVMVCSETQNRKLFDHVLAGLGQCGIIVRAKLKMVPAKPMAANSTAVYFDPVLLQDDIRVLISRNELDSVYAIAILDPGGSGQLVWLINVAKFHDASETPDMAFFMRDLHFIPPTFSTVDMPYLDYQLIVDNQIDQLRAFGLFEGVMHPWFDAFLPDSQVGDYVSGIVSGLQPDDVGPFGFVLMFPLFTSTITRPLFRLPDEELVWLFDVLTSNSVPGFDADFAANKRARNNVWFEMARDVGGTRYPIGTLDFTPGDWRRHYGSEWHGLKQAKHEFDPQNILTPGPGIFPRSH